MGARINDHNQHIQRLGEAIDQWLRPDNGALKSAIDRTIQEGLFAFPDIKHRIRTLKATLTPDALAGWAGRAGLNPGELAGQRILSLQAGNLPVAGIQDLLLGALTGSSLSVKLSRRDPWIPATFLEELVRYGVLEDSVWSTVPEELVQTGNTSSEADYILFSGSSASVPQVRERITRLGLAGENSSWLIRSAHFSIAWVPSTEPQIMEDLIEAVFRYGGRGCRSVGLVVSPHDLDSIKCEMTDYIEAFWLKNPQHAKPAPSLRYRFAWNKAAGIPQAWLDDFLIEETLMLPEEEFLLHWTVGDEEKVAEIARTFSKGLQSVYLPSEEIRLPDCGRIPELLSTAQVPPVDWTPDGIDPLEWILEESKRR